MIKRFYPQNDKVLNFNFVQNDEDFIVEEQAIKFSGNGSFLVLKVEKANTDHFNYYLAIIDLYKMIDYLEGIKREGESEKFIK